MFVTLFRKAVLPEFEKSWTSLERALPSATRGDLLKYGRATGVRLEVGKRFQRDGKDYVSVAFKRSKYTTNPHIRRLRPQEVIAAATLPLKNAKFKNFRADILPHRLHALLRYNSMQTVRVQRLDKLNAFNRPSIGQPPLLSLSCRVRASTSVVFES
ncbi:hypothetical protein FA95DRAFT_1574013 [Auriscalpium vulgare]|uniref:Uncharacterized protein n=1 Tax=Auriscalpium vulgare TaxID=40419 RepID=A0ACB8RMI1_9AGAM|nr:hypothetical protein FA95DRAFT_1574013 [Auriscalpium vulgare]